MHRHQAVFRWPILNRNRDLIRPPYSPQSALTYHQHGFPKALLETVQEVEG